MRLGNARGTAWAGHDLALLALDEGRTDEAERLLTEALELFDSIDYDWAAAVCACLLASAVGTAAASAADVDRAATLLARALRLHYEVGDRRGIAQCLEVVAEVALARGAAATAARLVGAADAGRARRAAALATEPRAAAPGRPRPAPGPRPGPRRRRARAARRADHAARPRCSSWPAGWSRWRAGGAAAVELTARQLEVAALVAAGRTNRQIGTPLGISEKTAEVHVRNIMARLGVPSRAGVAAWAAARGLAQPRPLGVSPYVACPAVARRQRSRPRPRGRTPARGPGRDMTWTRTS